MIDLYLAHGVEVFCCWPHECPSEAKFALVCAGLVLKISDVVPALTGCHDMSDDQGHHVGWILHSLPEQGSSAWVQLDASPAEDCTLPMAIGGSLAEIVGEPSDVGCTGDATCLLASSTFWRSANTLSRHSGDGFSLNSVYAASSSACAAFFVLNAVSGDGGGASFATGDASLVIIGTIAVSLMSAAGGTSVALESAAGCTGACTSPAGLFDWLVSRDSSCLLTSSSGTCLNLDGRDALEVGSCWLSWTDVEGAVAESFLTVPAGATTFLFFGAKGWRTASELLAGSCLLCAWDALSSATKCGCETGCSASCAAEHPQAAPIVSGPRTLRNVSSPVEN